MDIGQLLDARFREQAEKIEILRRELEDLKRRRQEVVPAEDWVTTAVFLKRHASRFTTRHRCDAEPASSTSEP
jgi:hypothetical protein